VQHAINARTNRCSQKQIALCRPATRSEPACSRHPLTVRTMRNGLWLLAIGLALTTSCSKPPPEVKPPRSNRGDCVGSRVAAGNRPWRCRRTLEKGRIPSLIKKHRAEPANGTQIDCHRSIRSGWRLVQTNPIGVLRRRGADNTSLPFLAGSLVLFPRLAGDPGSAGMASIRQPLMAHCEWPPGAP
jgi:hypothetical protein